MQLASLRCMDYKGRITIPKDILALAGIEPAGAIFKVILSDDNTIILEQCDKDIDKTHLT